MEVTLMEMLEAREKRALRQRQLLDDYGQTLVCFTMNIAGPVKSSPLIRRGFDLGRRALTEQLAVGSVTNMYTIVEKLAGAGKVIKP